MRYDADDQEKLDAERGYAVRGEREVRMREWFSLREEGEKPKDFERLIGRLRAKKYWATKSADRKARIVAYRKQWAKDHAEQYRAAVNKAKRERRKLKTPSYLREMEARRAKRRAESFARRAATVFTCVVCQAQWCTLLELPKGFPPKYCSQPCRSRANYRRMKANGRR